jgi:hypothetical protein
MDAELKHYLDTNFGRIGEGLTRIDERVDKRFAEIDKRLAGIDKRFAAFTEAQTIRLRKVEADQSNLDSALSGRVAVLEKRLLEIELRLGRA